jgi:predicted DNA-binding transcriptional regulator AlpA
MSALLDAKNGAAFLGISVRKFYQLRAQGALPAPVRLGERTVRYRRSDLVTFVERLQVAESIPEPQQLAAGKAKRQAERAEVQS